MALDELHARRLATVANIVASALARIEVLLRAQENGPAAGAQLTADQIQRARQKVEDMRRGIDKALEGFAVHLHKPEPKQVLAAELSTLWVVLENARPERLKGYGRKFVPADKADWERLIEDLLRDLEQIRSITLAGERPAQPAGRCEKK